MSKKSISEKKPKMKKRTMFTIVSILNLFWYTVIVLILSYFDKMVPAELTIGWFAAWTIELGLLYGIKVKSKDNTSINYGGGSSIHDNEYYPISAEDEGFQEEEYDNKFETIQTEGDISDYDKDLG